MSQKLKRTADIGAPGANYIEVELDGDRVNAIQGETILSTLFAVNKKVLACNDHQTPTGAYCGMGVCYCCTVKVDDQFKVKACQTLVKPGMKIKTQTNKFKEIGL